MRRRPTATWRRWTSAGRRGRRGRWGRRGQPHGAPPPPRSRLRQQCRVALSEDSPAEVCSVLTSHTSSIYSRYYPHRLIPRSSSLHPACLLVSFREAKRVVYSPADPVGPAGVRTNAPSVWFLNKGLPAKLDPDPLGRRGLTGTLTIFLCVYPFFLSLFSSS